MFHLKKKIFTFFDVMCIIYAIYCRYARSRDFLVCLVQSKKYSFVLKSVYNNTQFDIRIRALFVTQSLDLNNIVYFSRFYTRNDSFQVNLFNTHRVLHVRFMIKKTIFFFFPPLIICLYFMLNYSIFFLNIYVCFDYYIIIHSTVQTKSVVCSPLSYNTFIKSTTNF